MLSCDFLDAALTQDHPALVDLVQRLTTETIGHSDQRAQLINDCLEAGGHLASRYESDFPRLNGSDSGLSPKSVTESIYKAAYLYETVFTLSDNGSPLQQWAKGGLAATYGTIRRLKTKSPNWSHDIPLSPIIAQQLHHNI